MFHLFHYLLYKANWEDRKWNGIIIKRSQLITGRNTISRDTGISAQSVRTCLERLKSTNEITIKPTNKYSIITIINYDYYQPLEDNINQHINQQTNKQSTSNQPTTNHNEEYKNIKNKNKEEINKEEILEEKRCKEKQDNFNQWLLNTPIEEL